MEDYVSQSHLVGQMGSLTHQQIAKGIIPSLIFWGPPGTENNLITNYRSGI
jgi:putative ATPase